MYNDIYIKTEIDCLIANTNQSDYYNETEIDDIDNELSPLFLNTYNNNEIYIFLTDYYNIEHINTQLDLKANSLNTYTKNEIDNTITLLDMSSILSLINNSGTNIINIFRYPIYKIRS